MVVKRKTKRAAPRAERAGLKDWLPLRDGEITLQGDFEPGVKVRLESFEMTEDHVEARASLTPDLDVVEAEVEITGSSLKAIRVIQEGMAFDGWLPRSQVQARPGERVPRHGYETPWEGEGTHMAIRMPRWLADQHALRYDEMPMLAIAERMRAERLGGVRLHPGNSQFDELEVTSFDSEARETVRVQSPTHALPMPYTLDDALEAKRGCAVCKAPAGQPCTPSYDDDAVPDEAVVAYGEDREASERRAAEEHERLALREEHRRAESGPSACERLPSHPGRGVLVDDEATLADLLCAEAEP